MRSQLAQPSPAGLSAGSVRGCFFEILVWTAQHLTSELLHRFPAQAAFHSLAACLKNRRKTRLNATATAPHG
nr:hypothetical protein [uncultured Campylobacter sp.]